MTPSQLLYEVEGGMRNSSPMAAAQSPPLATPHFSSPLLLCISWLFIFILFKRLEKKMNFPSLAPLRPAQPSPITWLEVECHQRSAGFSLGQMEMCCLAFFCGLGRVPWPLDSK